ncbi:MAG TPA: GNAT family N-acetyltransferase [Nitrolancea sp.]|jgi:ribosomal protein S18 acetylase RimI-like enzyme|nr:GNAT family N-acetyltransferase [Nitrolancea sp.]
MNEEIDQRALVRVPLITLPPMQRYHQRPARRELHDGFAFLDLSGSGSSVNCLTVYSEPDPVQLVELARAFFGSEGFDVIVESETTTAFEARLIEHGWQLDEEEPAMLLTPIPEIPPTPAELDIRRVTTEAALADFMGITHTGQRWIPSLEAATDPNVAIFVGYVADRPVAASRINCMGEIGDINGVETLPEYRRRGIGTAMTWAAVAAGRDRDCSAITLSASAMGYPVYRRMGFEPVCVYRTYIQPDTREQRDISGIDG